MNEFIQVTVAIDSEEGAHKIAEALVSKRLAASVWVSGPIISRYWWKGNIEKAEEWVCTVKTRQDLYQEVEQAIKDVHSYEVPGILAIPVVAGSQSYFDWINRETAADERGDHTVTPKEQLLQELIDAHERLIAAATAAFERGVDREGEQWGPREVMAHIAGWEANALVRVPKIVAGAPHVKYDHDAFNTAVIMAIGDQSFETVRDMVRQAYQRDIEMLKKLDESIFVPGNYPYERTKAAISHNYEHAQELDERTERRGKE